MNKRHVSAKSCAWTFVAAFAALLLSGCATNAELDGVQREFPAASDAWVAASRVGTPEDLMKWEHYQLPGKRPTYFGAHRWQGRDALVARADGSVSMIRRKLQVLPQDLGSIQFSWLLDALNTDSDMAHAQADDASVRIVLAFGGDRRNFSPRNAMLSELAHVLSGEPLPYATMMYSWCPQRPVGATIVNPRTDRIRTLVVESGDQGLGRWQDYKRDIAADFRSVFGEEPGPLLAVGLMTDADNTQSKTIAWYGPVSLEPKSVKLSD
jgi:hypothetical protein